MTQRLVHFLLVEDDDAHAKLISRTLEQNRISNRLDRVVDGEAALEFLEQRGAFADARRPDIVLLDLKLPKLDGHEVLGRIKGNPRLASLPVVVLTTSDAEADRLRAYELHANSYLVKPVDFERLRQMVADLSLYWGLWNRPAPEPGP